MIPASCALDAAGASAQLSRYRRAGAGAVVLERTPRRLSVRLIDSVPEELVHELVEIERECCSFFALDWDRNVRQLTIAVSRSEEEPALDAIACALGVG